MWKQHNYVAWADKSVKNLYNLIFTNLTKKNKLIIHVSCRIPQKNTWFVYILNSLEKQQIHFFPTTKYCKNILKIIFISFQENWGI